MNTSPPLLFLDFLADRQLNPAAILFKFTDADNDALPLVALLDDPACLDLLEEFPCFIRSAEARRFSTDGWQGLEKAGLRELAGDLLFSPEVLGGPEMPVSTQWIAGNGVLAAPAKASASQTTSRLLALKLLERVTADGDIHDIEEIFRRDPGLSYHLLKIVNSVGMGSGRKISSLAQAILILGRQQLKRWLSLMLFSAAKEDRRSAMLLARATVRARSMELLAKRAGLDRAWQELAFMAGMFSLLGVLFDLPLAEILKPLHISDVLVGALLRHENDLGELLRTVEMAESGNALELTRLLTDLGLSPLDFNLLTLEAHLWMLRFVCANQEASHA
jgi:EAL and modified HD-GYP domain-containing signal transduction protein